MKKDIVDQAPFLDMAPGLHGIDYPQRFVRAEGANNPGPNNDKAMKCDPQRIMKEVCEA